MATRKLGKFVKSEDIPAVKLADLDGEDVGILCMSEPFNTRNGEAVRVLFYRFIDGRETRQAAAFLTSVGSPLYRQILENLVLNPQGFTASIDTRQATGSGNHYWVLAAASADVSTDVDDDDNLDGSGEGTPF